MRTPRAPKSWDLEGDPRFELRRALGSGSFGSVFEVFDRERAAKVALKLLKRIEAEELYRFKQEFRALADITHPNLVGLYELLGARDRWFFTMELVEGTDALAFVRGDSEMAHAATLAAQGAPIALGPRASANEVDAPFDEPRLRGLLLQLVEGLTALHAAGKIHRDVKPSNVLVTHDGRVVLVDFGLAVRLSASGELSRRSLVGTPEYLAPEMVRGHPATAASDWYAVGVLLFQALTGKLPFAGSLQEILSQKVTRDAPAPHDVVADLPPDLDQLCVDLLARDPAARPGGAALLLRLGSHAAPRSGKHELPFIGRASERETLANIFGAVREGGTAAVAMIGGVSGIGKSALVGRACADMREIAPGAVILSGRCWEQESVPYKAIDGLVDPLSRHLKTLPTRLAQQMIPHDVRLLAQLFPVLDQVEAIANARTAPVPAFDALERRRAMFRALRELLARLAQARPLVLVIDDLQWGDRDSGAFLNELLAPPDPPPLLLVLSYRSDEVATSACLQTALPALRAMEGPSVRVASIDLDALADDEARQLARTLLPDALVSGDEIAKAVAREAGGRPFFIYQLAEASRERAERGETQERASAVSLDALLRARAADLSGAARRLLETVAVAGRPVDRAAAARAADLGDEEPAAYSALRGARLVRSREIDDREELETYHDRIRETITQGLSAERRVEVFRALAEALDGTGRADPETLAVYFLGGRRPDRAGALAEQAATEASRSLAFDRAARLCRLALDLCAAGDPRVLGLREALADALVTVGRGAEAAAELTLAADTAPPARAFELRRRAAEQLLFAGRIDEGMVAIRRCLADVGLSLPDRMWQRLLGALWELAWLTLRRFSFRPRPDGDVDLLALRRADTLQSTSRAFSTSDTVLAVYLCTRAVRFALAAGERRRALEALGLFSAFALVVGGSVSWFVRRPRVTIDALVKEIGDERAQAVIALLTANAKLQNGEPAAAREPLRASLEVVRALRVGASWEVNILQELSCMQLHWTGAWRDLSENLATVLAEARDQGNQHLDRGLTIWFGHVPSLLDDDPDRAERTHAAARAGWWPPKFSALDHFSLMARTDIALYTDRGAGPRAQRHLEAHWPSLERSQILRLEAFAKYQLELRTRASLALAAHADTSPRDRRAAITQATRDARRLSRMQSPLAQAFSEHASAGVAAARREDRQAIAGYARAETAFEAVGCMHYAAAARRRRGLLIGGDEGHALVQAAEARFAAEGARDPARIAAMLAPGRPPEEPS